MAEAGGPGHGAKDGAHVKDADISDDNPLKRHLATLDSGAGFAATR